MTRGFRWCPHCKKPHSLRERFCLVTGKPLEQTLHAAALPPPRDGFIGTVLEGKYRILRVIGAGGMGQVFEAENLQLARMVAIKVVGGDASPQALLRLEREARVVAAIQHPNICDVYDFGRTPHGGPYIVFERLFGETLAAKMQRVRQLSIRSTVDVFSQMLSGLHAAHSARIIHRDLKPQNVFLVDRLGCDPLVKLVDFGLAQDLAATTRITRPGRICGTLQYMSPEQLRVATLDHRSDLFSVGVMLYEALTGKHPFAAESRIQVQVNVLEAKPRPVESYRPDLGRELAQTIAWALARDPKDRPATAMDLQRALISSANTVSSVSLDEGPPSLTEPLWLAPTSSPAA